MLFTKKEKFSYVSNFENGVARFNIGGVCDFKDDCNGGYWGLIDYRGKILISNLEWISSFINNYAIFQRDYKFGLLRKDGRIVIPAKLDEIIVVDENFIFYRIGNKWGITNSMAEIVYETQFNNFMKLSDSLFLVSKGGECDIFNRCEGAKYGILSKNGKFIIPIKFDGISEIKDSFVEVSLDGRWGLMTLKGKTIIPNEYEEILYFLNMVWFKSSGKWGLMELDRKVVIYPKYEGIAKLNGSSFLKYKLNGKWGIVSYDGKEITKPEFDEVVYLADNYFLVRKDTLKGVLDKQGNIVFDIKFKDMVYGNGIFVFFDGNKWIYKNFKLDFVEILDSIIIAQVGNFFGAIDTYGKIVLDFKYDSIKIIDNFVIAKKHYKWILFDRKFRELFSNIDSFEVVGNFLKFRVNYKWGLVNRNLELVLEPIFDYIDNVDELGNIRLVRNGKFGLYSLEGGKLIDTKYRFIYRFYKDVYKVVSDEGFTYIKTLKFPNYEKTD
ncbi:MAG: WG repeat-containing protein [candidate division WOR-3 bacterium]|nr:WG repeat-containing protein [candidate division WOR-3 bacterium]MDW8150930.1 WG repeat-containing protein [candidate division WOR-3 bacterium]